MPFKRLAEMLRLGALVVLLSSASPGWAHQQSEQQAALKVTATAYNSLPGQTQGRPNIGAWGHRLKPGLKAIAVSRDLLALGLGPGTEVEIVGLPGRYRVLDKMHSRWQRKIDIYMGKDEDAALEWGKRAVTIRWLSQDS